MVSLLKSTVGTRHLLDKILVVADCLVGRKERKDVTEKSVW